MGSDLHESDPQLFDRYFGRAEDSSGLPVRRYALEGPIEELTRTDVAQPALFSLSLALADVARELGLSPHFVAGHSLGEYTAAISARALGAEEGIRVVCRRGELMAGIQSQRPGAMAAVIGLPDEVVAKLCQQASEAGAVALANLNSPTQVVASGEEAAVERLVALAKGAGAQRALRLQVGAAFHSELMKPVQAELGNVMRGLRWEAAEAPLAANFSGQLVQGGDEIREALIAQIASPVRWVECVRTLADAGCRTFLEVGPGRVLSGLIRQIDGVLEAVPADSRQKLREFAAAHPQFVRPAATSPQ
jgi:[acyl-carrier-protein] S-malonyltransferase